MFSRAVRRKREESIQRLYGAIVAQSREPAFYRSLGVPDTLEGRFDLLVLHLHLVYRRLAAVERLRDVGQGLFDHFVGDMDASLREIGVGDLAIPKRMRALGEAFYGRAAAYDAALGDADNARLAVALLRNVYSGDDQAAAVSERLAAYMRSAAAALSAQDADAIAAGEVQFPDPEGRDDER